MTESPRDAFLNRCRFTDRDCMDRVARVSLRARAPLSAAARALSFPDECWSCDFCDVYAPHMGQCVTCKRLLSLSECDCASPSYRRDDASSGDDDHDDASALQTISCNVECYWCHAGIGSAPPSCGRHDGVLRRVVFVLEPKQSDDQNACFNVGQRVLVNMLETCGLGSFLLYSLESGASVAEWRGAFAAVHQFASDPQLYLPHDARMAPDCRISLIVATHALHDNAGAPGRVRLELAGDVSRSIDWWIARIRGIVTETESASAMRIDQLHLMTCALFRESAAERSSALLQALADDKRLAIFACDGQQPMFLRLAALSTRLIAAVRDQTVEVWGAGAVRCFQPSRPVLSIVPESDTISVTEFHADQIGAVVQRLAAPAPASATTQQKSKRARQQPPPPPPPPLASDRMWLLRDASQGELRRVLLAAWPFSGGAAAPLSANVATYAQLFRAAAAVIALTHRCGLHYATLVDWLAQDDVGRRDAAERALVFLGAARLAHDGMLDDGSGERASLERALVRGLVRPPSLNYVRRRLDMKLFAAALPQLRAEWERLEAVESSQQ